MAVSVTKVPAAILALHVEPQAIPPTSLITFPAVLLELMTFRDNPVATLTVWVVGVAML